MLCIFTDGRSAAIPADSVVGARRCCVEGCPNTAWHSTSVEFICPAHWLKVDVALRIARGRLIRRLLRKEPPRDIRIQAQRTWRMALEQASA